MLTSPATCVRPRPHSSAAPLPVPAPTHLQYLLESCPAARVPPPPHPPLQYLEEFMSTRLGVKRTAEVVSAEQRTGKDGPLYYDVLVRGPALGPPGPCARAARAPPPAPSSLPREVL